MDRSDTIRNAALFGDGVRISLFGYAADARPDLGCYECQEKGLVPTVMSFR